MTDAVFKNGAAFWLLWVLPVVILLAVLAHRGNGHPTWLVSLTGL